MKVAAGVWRFRARASGEAAGGPEPGKSELFFTLQEDLTGAQDAADTPGHSALPGSMGAPAAGERAGPRVLAEDAQDRLSLEGTEVQRLERRPAAAERSWRRKRRRIEWSRRLARTAPILDVPSDQLQTCRQSSVQH